MSPGNLTDDGVRQMVDRLAQGEGQGRYNSFVSWHRTAQAWLDNGVNAEVVAQALVMPTRHHLSIYGNQDEK